MYSRCDEVISRIKSGRYYNRKLKLYTKEYLNSILDELQIMERYEDCVFINKFMDRRFNYLVNYKSPIL